MKRFAMTVAVVGMVMLFASVSFGFYAWAPYATWGNAASSSSSGVEFPTRAAASSGAVWGDLGPAWQRWGNAASGWATGASSGYQHPISYVGLASSGYGTTNYASSSGGYWPMSGSASGVYGGYYWYR